MFLPEMASSQIAGWDHVTKIQVKLHGHSILVQPQQTPTENGSTKAIMNHVAERTNNVTNKYTFCMATYGTNRVQIKGFFCDQGPTCGT